MRRTLIGGSLLVLLLAACGSPEGQHGVFESIDGVGTSARSGHPMTDRTVLVLPTAAADLLGPGTGPDGSPPEVGYAEVTADEIEGAGGQVVVTDDRGRFTLDVPPGTYYGCCAEGDPGRDPLGIYQCAEVDLGEDAEIHVAWGEGFGFWVEE